MRLSFFAEHHRRRATGLSIDGDAHLLAVSTIRRRTVNKVHGHHDQAVLVLARFASPRANALLVESQRRLGIIARDIERQLIDNDIVLGRSVDCDYTEIAFLHGGIERSDL